MKILLVEPAYRKKSAAMVRGDKDIPDDSLWYPPIGLMKISRYHKNRKDDVYFVAGIPDYEEKFSGDQQWDIIYVATVFTFYFKKTVETINYFKEKGRKIIVGGILATLMPTDIFIETGVHPLAGLLTSSNQLGFDDGVDIDKLTPDYSILFGTNYAVYDTFYAYTTRGCKIGCPWCAVPKLEPHYEDYIDIKEQIKVLRKECGDYSSLKLMDNNILISPRLADIIDDLVTLGYGRGAKNKAGKHRVVDFNQGVDASYINEETIELLARVNIVPLRIAFDRISEKKVYTQAVETAFRHGFKAISNYMLYNFKDTPADLYERIYVNINLNAKWKDGVNGKRGQVYCYPMRYAPINEDLGQYANRERNFFATVDSRSIDWLTAPVWTPKFSRNLDVIKGVAHGSIPTVPSLARRAIGRDFEEFVTNLYMPEEMLRNRDKYERTIYPDEKTRSPGNGEIEDFRRFILDLLHSKSDLFYFFHDTVASNRKQDIREALKHTKNAELIRWFERYLITT